MSGMRAVTPILKAHSITNKLVLEELMARRMTALIAGAGATALVLSACSGGSGSGTAAGSGDAAKKVTSIKLVAAEYSKDNTAAFWKQFAEKYKAKTGITLDVQVVSWDTIDQTSST